MEGDTLLFDLFINISIISSLLFVAGQLFKDGELNTTKKSFKILVGCGSGILGIFLMIYAVHIDKTVIADLRHISIVISAFYGGPLSSLITAAFITIYRIAAFGINKASLLSACNAIIMGASCALLCKVKIKPILKYVLLNIMTVIITNLVSLIIFSDNLIHRRVMSYFNLVSIMGAVFTYFLCSYIYSSNTSYRAMKYYRLMTDNLADLISTHDSAGKLIYVSSSCQALLGYSLEELHQLNLTELIFSEDLERINNFFINECYKKDEKAFEYRIKCKNSHYKWIETSVKVIKNKDGFFKEYICVSRDISLRKNIEEILKKTNQRLSALFNYAGMGIVLKDMDGNIIDYNPNYKRLLGNEGLDSLEGNCSRSDLIKELKAVEKVKADEVDHYSFEKKYFTSSGEIIYTEVTITKIPATAKEPAYLIYMIRDITLSKIAEIRLAESEEKFRSLVHSINDIIFTLDADQRHTGLYGQWMDKYELSTSNFLGKKSTEIFGDIAGKIHEEANEKALKGENVVYEWSIDTSKGTFSFQTSLSPINNTYGEVLGLVGVGRDITKQKQLESELTEANAKLKRLSFMDGLTRIPNRRYFDEYLMEQWEVCRNSKKDFSMLLLDIDYFKAYNDTYGHLEGDECLKLVAKTLVQCLESNSNLAFRYGGEEFVIVLPGVSAKESLYIAEKIRSTVEALKIPNINSKVKPFLTISVGACAIAPTDDHNPLDFVEKVDQLLYDAKSQGRNRVCS